MQLTKIVITGGPCAGKSTAMNWIQNAFTQKGYRVLFIPETATELITGGVAPWTCGSNLEYQKCQMKSQIQKEAIFAQGASTMNAEKILLVCDRGALDNKAYMTPEEFSEVLTYLQLNEVDLKESYDAIFHLVTAAKGAGEFYTTANNQARIETPDQACALDEKLISAWTGHPHLKIIDNSTNFEDKMHRLIGEISAFLGEPIPFQKEHKFLVDIPDLVRLESYPSCKKVEIYQTYLSSPDGMRRRIRRRGIDGHYVYYEKRKTFLGSSDDEVIITENRLSEEDYLRLLSEADPDMKPLSKTRYCFTYQDHYYELDVYPFWKDKAMLMIELPNKDAPYFIPEFLHVQREITHDPAFRNHKLAALASE
ncbi:MAG: AAA family ATPase [Blautia sp.]|nr:AAA family ATPase [Aeriscardovia sp.]MBQ1491748.1 AAA family ATPase [Blautia sp.]